MRPIDKVIVHCTATRPEWWAKKPTESKVREVRRWHVEDNGWRDIGYHYLIDRDGTVAKGRHVAQIGAHCRGHNKGSVGVALFGGHGSSETDKFEENFTPEQDKALRSLIRGFGAEYGKVTIHGHNEFAAKACPGFNVSEWLTGERPKPPADPRHPKNPIALVVAAAAAALAAVSGWIYSLFGG